MTDHHYRNNLRNSQQRAKEADDAKRTQELEEAQLMSSFVHAGMEFRSWKIGDWYEVYFWRPGEHPDRDRHIGMRRERHARYSLWHVEEAAKEMAVRVLPRFTN